MTVLGLTRHGTVAVAEYDVDATPDPITWAEANALDFYRVFDARAGDLPWSRSESALHVEQIMGNLST